MPRTILVTGFGPFPGAPRNPTAALVRRLSRLRRGGLRIVSHVFETSYAAVDRDLPALLKRHRPDALLMFGLSPRATTLRLETLARNAVSREPDAAGVVPKSLAIARGGPVSLKLATPAAGLLAAGLRLLPSRNAGDYLCNYLCWRAAETANQGRGPRLATFVHVRPVRSARDAAALIHVATAILMALAGCLAGARNRS